ncbi:restriction endonuclease subunit S [Photobacterium leiognathi subsp. mandapamensis]
MVPNGWETRHLEEVTTKISDGIHSTPKYAEQSPVFFVNGNNLKNGKIVIQDSTKLVDEENAKKHRKSLSNRTILMSINGTIGNIAYYGGENIVLGKSACYINVDENTNVDFIYYVLSSAKTQAFFTSELTGSTIKNLSLKTIKLTKVDVPPLPEQRKIAQILSTWDHGIATTEKLIDASKQQKKALMQQLLTGKKRLVDPETGKAFEGDWEEVRLIDTVSKEKYSFTGGPFGSDLKSSDYTENGVRIIQLQNIGDGTFHNSYQIFTSQEKADELVSCNIFPDDIIISKMGDPVARATLIPHIHQRYLMASDGIRLAIDKSKYNNRFILETINYREFRNNALAKSTGSTRRRIGLTDLKNIKFRVPELIEQQKIASVLTAADNEVELLEAKLAHLKQEKKALMQQLLTGKRRVQVVETEVA